MAYAWGDPEDSRLGGVDVRQHHKPQPIKALTQMLRRLRFKIASAQDPHEQTIIACGVSHNLILTTAGRLLAWGCGRYGQLGYGDLWDREEPVVVPTVSSVRAFAAGSRHTIAISVVPGSSRSLALSPSIVINLGALQSEPLDDRSERIQHTM